MAESYATLSHCWGKAKTLKLLTTNIGELRAGFSISELPTSYREAISVATRCHIRYIWIDSLCIVQDSTADWLAEAGRMKDVYQNAILNISAAAELESSMSSLTDRAQSLILPLAVNPTWVNNEGRSSAYYLIDLNSYYDAVENSPLRRRAWVLLEAYLSGRNLSLTRTQLWWECRELSACEAWPAGLPRQLRIGPAPKTTSLEKAYRHGLVSSRGVATNHMLWDDLVEKYSTCGITFFSDKMVALSGPASHFQQLVGGDQYVAGMWRSRLLSRLLWLSDKYRRAFRPVTYRAPSWSSASLEGSVSYINTRIKEDVASAKQEFPMCEVVDVNVTPLDRDYPTGPLKGGYLRLRGPILEVAFRGENLAVARGDGQFGYIPGSDEDSGQFPDDSSSQNSCLADLDENTADDQPVISSLDVASAQSIDFGDLANCTRISRHLTAWRGGMWSIPLVEWNSHGTPTLAGLLLVAVKDGTTGVFERAGTFHATGLTATAFMKGGNRREIVII